MALAVTLAAVALAALATAQDKQDVPTAVVAQGVMRGAALQSRLGATFYAFRGIPFAQPPVGPLRFSPPVPAGPWKGELDATKDAPQCVQKNYLLANPKVEGQEDCLYLNVYTPKMSPPFGLLPVLVYIYGGGWFAGSANSAVVGPLHLMDRDVVLVTMNYRMGALGFLSTDDEVAAGNYAMKDQVEALRWVHANIAAFGGDPNTVTLFGQSAGAASVHLHMLSPLSQGLFHRAISQSGSALNAWAWPMDPRPIAHKQAQLMGCPVHSSTVLIECLRNVDAANLTDVGDNFHFWSVDPLTVFRPVVEHGSEAFLPDNPFTLIQMGAFSDIPWMHGIVSKEGIVRAVPILTNATLLEDLNANFNNLMPRLMELENSAPLELQYPIWRNISDFYFGSCNTKLGKTNQEQFIELYSDRSFNQGFWKSAMLHLQAGHSKQYLYHFNYRGLYSYASVFAPSTEDFGVCHCDELIYLFSSPALFLGWPSDHPDLQVIDNLITLWTNFAKYGEPTPTSSTVDQSVLHGLRDMDDSSEIQFTPVCADIKSVKWEPIRHPYSHDKDHYQLQYLDIAPAPKGKGKDTLQFCMRVGLYKDRFNFWESLPLWENKDSSYLYYLMPFYYMVGLFF